MDDILRNGNSTVNQNVKSKLVHREILACVTQLVESNFMAYELTNDPEFLSRYDDIENLEFYPEFNGELVNFDGGNFEEWEEIKEEITDKIDEHENFYIEHYYLDFVEGSIMYKNGENYKTIIEKYKNDLENLENLEPENNEILEWWIVDSYMAGKLRENGEMVVEYGCNDIWGRSTSEQAILLDFVITKIAYDRGILEGQENHKFWID